MKRYHLFCLMQEFQKKAAQIQQSMQIIMKSLVEQINAMQKAFPDDNSTNRPQNLQNVIIVPNNQDGAQLDILG